MGLKRACGAFLSPLRWSAERRTTTPVPSSKEGDYGGRNEIFSNLRLARCKAADPWLWLAGLAVCRKREGVPLPRSGGGWEGANAPAAPYKHRLAHAPGGRRPSGRAFRCVGFLGRSPKSLLGTFGESKVPPRRAGIQIKTFCKALPAEGEMKLCHSLCRQSLRHGCAVPPLFAQGRLWAYRQATANLANSLLLLLRGKAAFRRRAAIFPRRVGKAGKNRMNTGKKA